MSYTRSFDLNDEFDIEKGNDSIENSVVNLEDDGSPNSQNDELLSEGDHNVDNDDIIPLHVELTFTSGDEVLEYCHAYGKANGFQIRIRSSDPFDDGANVDGVDGHVERYRRLRLECSRAGIFDSKTKNPGKGSSSSAIECPFKVNASRRSNGFWVLTKVELKHNHECVPKNSKFLPNYRFISEINKKRILENDRAGVPIAKNYGSFVVQHGNHDNVPFDERDCRNLIAKSRRLHMKKGDFNAMRKHFEEMSSSNSDFFYSYDLDEDNRLRNVFWADGRSRAAYFEFGDVLSFDTTYVANMYRLPFAPFIGVNNHGQTVLFGCALLAGEEIGNFVWLFRTWLTCMSNKAPTAILTDQCRSIGNAIAQVFPNTPHRWCIWHVMQNAYKHLSQNKEWKEIHSSLQNALHDSLSISEFENAWKEMVECYGLEDNKWLIEMYEKRHRWVPIYFKDHFWAGMSSTQRSEGMNHFFKKYVNPNTSLTQFVEQYGLALSRRVREEEKANFTSLHKPIQCMTEHVFEVVFQKLYTSSKLEEFQKEVRDMMYNNATKVHDDGKMCLYDIVVKKSSHGRPHNKTFRVTMDRTTMDLKCECRNFEFRGIVCTHMLRVFHEEELDFVPERYILDRWRKDLPRKHLKVSVPYYKLLEKKPEGIQRNENMHELLDSFAGFAMNDEELYNEVMTTLDGLKTKIKVAAKGKQGLYLHTLKNIGKVYGRQRLIDRVENNDESDPEEHAETQVRDPIDQRRRGRARTSRYGFARDRASGSRKKKKATKPSVSESHAQTSSAYHHMNVAPHPNMLYHSGIIPTYAFPSNGIVRPPFQIPQFSYSIPPFQQFHGNPTPHQ